MVKMKNISKAFALIMRLAEKDKVKAINKLDGCWERRIDDNWQISLNGHPHTVLNSRDMEVLGFSCLIEFNGFPAGMLDPAGGIIAAGQAANEDTFIEAIERILDEKNNPSI